MRVVRTILGILLLTIGLPLLLAGGGLWAAMQHRDAGGAFSGALEKITNAGYAVVVPDVDGLLRREAPFTRSDNTRLRITARTPAGPAFIGIAPAAEAEKYLAGVGHTRVEAVKLTRGALPVRVAQVAGTTALVGPPADQKFWVSSGTGALEWSPSAVRGQQLTLVVMSADGQLAQAVDATAELRPGWLNSTAWGLLILGSVILLLGIAVLAWPARTREVVYVVDPAQVPEIAAQLGVPVPSLATPSRLDVAPDRVPDRVAEPAGRSTLTAPREGLVSVPVARPATLAESTVAASGAAPVGWPGTPPATPNLAWPPLPAAATRSSDPDSPEAAEPQAGVAPALADVEAAAGAEGVAVPADVAGAPDGERKDGQPQDGQPQDGQPQDGERQDGEPQRAGAGNAGAEVAVEAASGSDAPEEPAAESTVEGVTTDAPTTVETGATPPPETVRTARRKRAAGPDAVGAEGVGAKGARRRSAPAARTAVDQPVTVGPAHGSGAAAAHAAAAAMSAAARRPNRTRGAARTKPVTPDAPASAPTPSPVEEPVAKAG